MTAPIQMLWVEGRLSALERLSMASFVRCGHPVHLYVYGEVSGVPEGVAVLDGRSILPAERICRYGPAAGPGAGSLALFSNMFRYAVLQRCGGAWSDCDVVCLKSLGTELAADYLIATEYGDSAREYALANGCLLKAPASSSFVAECRAITMSVDPDKARWGEIGPLMVSAMVVKHGLQRCMAPPWRYSPLGWWEFRRLVDDGPLPATEGTLTVHCFNEMWRRAGLDKDARYGAGSPFESLKARYLAEAQPAASRAGA